ncbi:hypothetical protein SESBI_17313 [Sesbania bispinosa]|nr:hypothetical protein SESBI_17313 [Sesbania bispinosa]
MPSVEAKLGEIGVVFGITQERHSGVKARAWYTRGCPSNYGWAALIGAFVHVCSLPLFVRFFADLVNSFGSNANNLDKMTQEVVKVTT